MGINHFFQKRTERRKSPAGKRQTVVKKAFICPKTDGHRVYLCRRPPYPMPAAGYRSIHFLQKK